MAQECSGAPERPPVKYWVEGSWVTIADALASEMEWLQRGLYLLAEEPLALEEFCDIAPETKRRGVVQSTAVRGWRIEKIRIA